MVNNVCEIKSPALTHFSLSVTSLVSRLLEPCLLQCACMTIFTYSQLNLPAIDISRKSSIYNFVSDIDYPVEDEDVQDDPNAKYIIKLLDYDERPPETYEYKVIKKKNSRNDAESPSTKKESAFRERSHHSDNERLRDLFVDKNEAEENKKLQERANNDAEYALLLGQLWSKYKYNKAHANNVQESAPQGVVKLYKEKIVKKRYPDNWGPIAFKRKRSSDPDIDRPISPDYDTGRKHSDILTDPTYNAYEVNDDDKDDLREEYAIAFQPLDDDNLSELGDEDQYTYDNVEKRFPVTKRSSGPYNFGMQKKRFALDQNKHQAKTFRSSSGTDPRIIKDLSKIFGGAEVEIIKTPVKRSSDHAESSHDTKPPKVAVLTHNNNTHDHTNATGDDDDSHEHHGHNIHHPGMSGKEEDIDNEHEHEHHEHALNIHGESEKPINIKKKSIDWTDYFGIDKRAKKPSVSFVNDLTQDRLSKQYFDTFNKEVIYPLNSFRKHSNVKRNYVQAKPNDESETQITKSQPAAHRNDDKRDKATDTDDQLDNIDRRLKTMEGLIVDDALHYSNVGEELDSKEEQEMKEKLLSRLAAAYSLEKMRKALKEFKQSLHIQKADTVKSPSPVPTDETKAKRVAVKKEKVEINSNDVPVFNNERNYEFEDEQGAGHYLNGKIEEQFSEGYMGGSGRHRSPVLSTGNIFRWHHIFYRIVFFTDEIIIISVGASGSCPVLTKIIQRCRGVDLLAGDRGQLFLPLCSLHQICYLCVR